MQSSVAPDGVAPDGGNAAAVDAGAKAALLDSFANAGGSISIGTSWMDWGQPSDRLPMGKRYGREMPRAKDLAVFDANGAHIATLQFNYSNLDYSLGHVDLVSAKEPNRVTHCFTRTSNARLGFLSGQEGARGAPFHVVMDDPMTALCDGHFCMGRGAGFYVREDGQTTMRLQSPANPLLPILVIATACLIAACIPCCPCFKRSGPTWNILKDGKKVGGCYMATNTSGIRIEATDPDVMRVALVMAISMLFRPLDGGG